MNLANNYPHNYVYNYIDYTFFCLPFINFSCPPVGFDSTSNEHGKEKRGLGSAKIMASAVVGTISLVVLIALIVLIVNSKKPRKGYERLPLIPNQ